MSTAEKARRLLRLMNKKRGPIFAPIRDGWGELPEHLKPEWMRRY